eukprot:gene5876-6168_t
MGGGGYGVEFPGTAQNMMDPGWQGAMHAPRFCQQGGMPLEACPVHAMGANPSYPVGGVCAPHLPLTLPPGANPSYPAGGVCAPHLPLTLPPGAPVSSMERLGIIEGDFPVHSHSTSHQPMNQQSVPTNLSAVPTDPERQQVFISQGQVSTANQSAASAHPLSLGPSISRSERQREFISQGQVSTANQSAASAHSLPLDPSISLSERQHMFTSQGHASTANQSAASAHPLPLGPSISRSERQHMSLLQDHVSRPSANHSAVTQASVSLGASNARQLAESPPSVHPGVASAVLNDQLMQPQVYLSQPSAAADLFPERPQRHEASHPWQSGQAQSGQGRSSQAQSGQGPFPLLSDTTPVDARSWQPPSSASARPSNSLWQEQQLYEPLQPGQLPPQSSDSAPAGQRPWEPPYASQQAQQDDGYGQRQASQEAESGQLAARRMKAGSQGSGRAGSQGSGQPGEPGQGSGRAGREAGSQGSGRAGSQGSGHPGGAGQESGQAGREAGGQEDESGQFLFDMSTQRLVPAADDVFVTELKHQGHELISVEEAFQHKATQLESLLNGPLMSKQEQLIQQELQPKSLLNGPLMGKQEQLVQQAGQLDSLLNGPLIGKQEQLVQQALQPMSLLNGLLMGKQEQLVQQATQLESLLNGPLMGKQEQLVQQARQLESLLNGPLMSKQEQLAQQHKATQLESLLNGPLMSKQEQLVQQLESLLNAPLMSKQEQLVQPQARLVARSADIRSAHDELQRQTRALAHDMCSRLTIAERAKQSELEAEQEEIAQQLEPISLLVQEAEALSAAGPAHFLAAFRILDGSCQQLLSKPFKESIDVSVDDLPHEARAYNELWEEHAALTKLLAVKDEMIWHLLRERTKTQDRVLKMMETERNGAHQVGNKSNK